MTEKPGGAKKAPFLIGKGGGPKRALILVWTLRAEIMTAVAGITGWCLVTWGLAELLTVWLWPVSLGVLLLGLAGWRFIGTLMVVGLYTLMRPESDKE